MGWSWSQFCEAPAPMIDVLLLMMKEEKERLDAIRAKNTKPGMISG